MKRTPLVPEDPRLSRPENHPKSSVALALVIGFLPAALVLLYNNFDPPKIRHPTLLSVLCSGLAAVSVVCCFASSRMLFGRKDGLATGVGVVLVLLNVFIACFAGCAALLIR